MVSSLLFHPDLFHVLFNAHLAIPDFMVMSPCHALLLLCLNMFNCIVYCLLCWGFRCFPFSRLMCVCISYVDLSLCVLLLCFVVFGWCFIFVSCDLPVHGVCFLCGFMLCSVYPCYFSVLCWCVCPCLVLRVVHSFSDSDHFRLFVFIVLQLFGSPLLF